MKPMLRQLVLVVTVVLSALTLQTNASAAPVLADPLTGGAKGSPIAILFLGDGVGKDSGYGEELTRQGIAFTSCSVYEPLAYEFIKKFNVIVIDRLAPIGYEYWHGPQMEGYWANMVLVRRAAEQGAGVLIYPNLADGGGALCGGWNQEMKSWGIQILPMCIRDQARRTEPWMVYGAEMYYSWTENLAKHPVTAGLKRVYYASANLRWDDCYTAPPLIFNSSWTPLVRAMPGATVAQQVDDKWLEQPLPKGGLVLAAVRNVGKGRLGVLAIHPYYIHEIGYARRENRAQGEMSPGYVDGIILKKGDRTVPSDTDALVSRLYTWLAADSATAGFGGYNSGEPIGKAPHQLTEEEKQFTPVVDFDHYVFPPSWRHRNAEIKIGDKSYGAQLRDPRITGELRYYKTLIGAHSNLSDGQGSVATYAAQAKKAGYALLVFTENFEKLSRERFNALLAQCAQNSSENFVCLPGFDAQDPDGNHFIVISPTSYPRASWLSADGKRLEKPWLCNFAYYNDMIVAHRPQAGPLPYERLKHFHGLTVNTYRDGKIVDDGSKAYAWQVQNTSMPIPIIVHELFSPTEVASAARTGFQQMMPADSVQHAVDYFRTGFPHFFDAPPRYMISEGPIVYNWVSSPARVGINSASFGPAPENRRHFRVAIGVKSDVPLASVTLYAGTTAVRHWLPTGRDFQATADFQLSRQYDLYVVAEDSKGRRAITSSLMTGAERYLFRCADRQNCLGDISPFTNCYTGSRLPDGLDFIMPVKGTAEGSTLFPTVRGTLMAPKLSYPFICNDVEVQDIMLDEKYTNALFDEVGLDAMPSRASQPSDIYTARRRTYSFTPGRSGQHWLFLTEYDITLKRDVEPVDAAELFPAFSGLRVPKFCRWEDGKAITGALGGDTVQNVPVGSMAGGFIALSPGFQVRNGQFGLAPLPGNPTKIPAGTHLIARFLYASLFSAVNKSPYWYTYGWSTYSFDDDPAGWLRDMGFAGATPYQLSLTRGKLEHIAYLASMMPEGGGVSGAVTQTAEIPYDVPLRIYGVNERWIAGSWREGDTIAYTGVFERTAWPRLDVSKPGKFYAGNLLIADNPDLVLEIVVWTKDRINVEVHNPTEKAISATVTTPAEITNYKRLMHMVTVPAGTTIYVNE